MKKNIILFGVMAVAAGALLTSCASDYLDLEPKVTITDAAIGKTTESLNVAVNAIGQQMYYPKNVDGEGGYPCGNAGEPSVMTLWGDAMGMDYFSNHVGIFQGGSFIKMEQFSNSRYGMNGNPWGLYYAIIGEANRVLALLDGAEETTVGQRDLLKAQCLTFRAHGYVRLMQVYGPRWSDSKNGERKSIVIRTEAGGEPSPLRTVNEVLALIYNDLNEAISLYEKPEVAALPRQNESMPTKNVAYGVYARAALLIDDWATAESMAHKAREGYSIMTGEQWCQGFITANQDYMWTNTNNLDDKISNISWGAYNACNGYFSTYNQINSGAINHDLIKLLDPNDIRITRFIVPENKYNNSQTNTKENWWNKKYVDGETMNMYDMSNKRWTQSLLAFIEEATPPTPSWSDKVATACSDINGKGQTPYVTFGQHLKFYVAGGSDQMNQFPWMRSTEFLLTEAEACYMQGKTAQAQTLIAELVSKRVPGYTTCSLTGQELLDFIRVQRRIEMWGEGTNFFDLKRWNVHNVRRAWVNGDPTSGSQPSSVAMDIAPDGGNHWTLMIPYVEYEYNDAVLADIAEISKWD